MYHYYVILEVIIAALIALSLFRTRLTRLQAVAKWLMVVAIAGALLNVVHPSPRDGASPTPRSVPRLLVRGSVWSVRMVGGNITLVCLLGLYVLVIARTANAAPRRD